MKFTSHNIDLGNGKTTLENEILWEQRPWTKSVIDSINLYFPPAIRPSIRIADLGTLEGGYAVAMARFGYQVVGFDARQLNLDKCLYVQEHLKLPNLSFVLEDVKNLDKHPPFDVYICNGLLYHLDKPASFLKLLGSMHPKMLVLDTHYAIKKDFLYDFLPFLNPYKRIVTKRLPFLARKHNFALSGLKQHDGKQGRWFLEYKKEATDQEIEKSVWAASSNDRSFWLVKQDLLQALKEAGFPLVYEMQGRMGDNYGDNAEYDRSLFICHPQV